MSLVHDRAAPLLRLLEPETAHLATLRLLGLGLGPRNGADDPASRGMLAGLRLPSLIGLAAGFDKNAQVPAAMLAAGFGFVECGTVTPLPQAGNPRPRLFRLSADRAVINRMGFNNAGLEAFAQHLAKRPKGIVGANVGANKDASDRIGDYVTGLKRLWGAADYFTLNISSPNTPGLRALQTKAALEELLGRIAEARAALVGEIDPPIFLKVAPDLEDGEIETISETVKRFGLDAVIIGNTTITRPPSLTSPRRGETGGLSGAPLAALSLSMLKRFKAVAADLPLIAAGGVASGADAYARLRAGASAVQIYSALVYEGPGLVGRIKRDLLALARADGFTTVAEAVGA